MAGICTSHTRKGGPTCDHRLMTVVLDGVTHTLHTSEGELDEMPWDDFAQKQFLRLNLKRLRVLGLALDNSLGRVIGGDEGNNVKQYMLLAKDVTKTNIGTSYVNVPPGLNGERSLVDFTGCTQFRIILNMNFIGTGPMNARVVRDGDSAVLYESPNITGAGEKELDTDWQSLPAAASGLTLVRLQAKSTTGADDPVFRRAVLLTR